MDVSGSQNIHNYQLLGSQLLVIYIRKKFFSISRPPSVSILSG
jgi:hypothetical protein